MLWNLAAVVLVALSPTALQEKMRTVTFSKDSLEKLPAGWKVDHTGKGAGVWKVIADSSAPSKSGHALAQLGVSPGSVFNVCVLEDTSYKDVEASVMFKSMKGIGDQGGGIVWRYVDAGNYYIARYNPLEENFRVYKVVAGKRMELDRKEKFVLKDGWHKITIKMVGNKIECSLNGQKLLEATDDTFGAAGKVGLWTKADAETAFDQFIIVEAKK